MPTSAASPATSRPRWLFPTCIAAAVVLAYANSVGTPFLFDDAGAVVNNPTIRDLRSLAAFTPPADGSTTTGRPLVNFSFALNHAISGDQPWSYHALNLLLHVLAALTLFGLLRRMLLAPGLQSASGHPSATAFAASLVWALHPLQTETVVCVAQRTELLCGLLYLATLYAFVRGCGGRLANVTEPSRQRPGWLTLSVIACLAGMATKEVMVTAPLVVLLYDRTFIAKSFAAAWRERRGYYSALASTWLLLGALLTSTGGARGHSAGFGLGISSWRYLLTQADALALYLRLSLWPHPLVLDYGTAVVSSLADVWWQSLLVLGLLAGTLWSLVRKPPLGFVGAWFFLILAPSSSFVPLVTQTMAEHRMYLPLAAVAAFATISAVCWLQARAVPVLVGVALLFGCLTAQRNHDYRSAVAIWEDNVVHRPHVRALTALGVAHLQSGHAADSLPWFEQAIAADPTHLSAQRNRALALLQLGRAAEAAAIFASLPGREPGEAQAFYELGNAFVKEQKFEEAAAAYARTIALAPGHSGAHANLGNIWLLQGRIDEAIAEYEAVLRLEPNNARVRENLQVAREARR